jgi:methoxymalonate biosynthesis acyl carrier protein
MVAVEISIKEKIKIFIRRFVKNKEVADDEDIFSTGFVNSLFAMQLVLFLEKEFGIVIDNNDLDTDNFKSINAIMNLIIMKSGSENSNAADAIA